MRNFKELDHTADIRFLLEADSLKNLFLSGLELIAELKKNSFCKNKNSLKFKSEFNIQSQDREILFVRFLSELLYVSHKNKVVICRCEFSDFTDKKVSGSFLGAKVDSFDEDIKAVTYNQLDIKKEDNLFKTVLVLDI